VATAFASFVTAAYAGELRAGAAKVSITPSADEFPYTVPKERSFVGVHDDLFARALVLDDGRIKVALVSVEVEEIPDAKRVVSEVAEAVGITSTNVIVAATHTHEALLVFYHGGVPNPIQAKEFERVRQGAVAAAREALSHLTPARISFARSEAWVNINNGEQAGLKRRYDSNGPSDKTLDVLRIQSDKGEPLALVVDYATHAEVMFRSVTKDGGYEVSGDIPGAVSRILEGNSAGAPVTLFLCGAEGDQKPLFMSVQPAIGKMPAIDEGAGGWALLDAQAQRLSAAVIDTIVEMKPGTSTVTLESGNDTVSCPGQHFQTDSQTGAVTIEERPPVAIPLSTIRMNDIAIAAVGGDVGSEIGKKIRADSPVPNTVVVTMLAGNVGYILPEASYAHPGHVRESPLKAGCAEHAIPKGIADLLGVRSK
jgi:hypothetical protein